MHWTIGGRGQRGPAPVPRLERLDDVADAVGQGMVQVCAAREDSALGREEGFELGLGYLRLFADGS